MGSIERRLGRYSSTSELVAHRTFQGRFDRDNKRASNFKLETTNKWIEGAYNPGQFHGINEVGRYAKPEEGCSSVDLAERLGNASQICQANIIGRVQMDTFKTQEAQISSSWHMLNVKESLLKELSQSRLDVDDHSAAVNLIYMLQRSRNKKRLNLAKHLHLCIQNIGLWDHKMIGNYIVPMFLDCGSVSDAHQSFNMMMYRNEHSWTSLMLGYIECGQSQHAFAVYQAMQDDRVYPSCFTFTALLKACTRAKELEQGRQLHAEIRKLGFEKKVSVGNALIHMYAKCGSLAEAEEVINKLQVRDVVSWSALISGYAGNGLGRKALECFKQMEVDGVPPNAVTFICTLKACQNEAFLDEGRKLHAKIRCSGLEEDILVGSTLVGMYAKCGSFLEAEEVFHKLSAQNIVAWTALISGYVEHGHGLEALKCFEQMKLKGVRPDAVMLACCLRACGSAGALNKGRVIHASVSRNGFAKDSSVGNTLVGMYARCGSFVEAQQVFHDLVVCDIISWNALVFGYVDNGYFEEALKCFEQMQSKGTVPNVLTFLCSLKACCSIRAINKGREIHAKILKKRLGTDLSVGNALIHMYVECGALTEALVVFERLPGRDVVSWTTLLLGYSKNGLGQEALLCLEMMQLEGISPDANAFVCGIKACGILACIEKVREIHAHISKDGFEGNCFVSNALVGAYAKCGSLMESWMVFDRLPVQDIVSWTTLVVTYNNDELGEEALKCIEKMEHNGLFANAVSIICSLKACGAIGAIDKGREIHAQIWQIKDPMVGNSLVDMYVKCCSLEEAQEVFNILPVRDVWTWNALIAGYAENELCKEALKCFEQMQLEDISPDLMAFVYALKSCASVGAIDKGCKIHTELRGKAFEKDLVVATTLIDMYAKCGSLVHAREVLNNVETQSIVSWNAIIRGYGMSDEPEMALQCFKDLQETDIKPDTITFTCLLAACSRASLVVKGQTYYKMMTDGYGIAPTTDHFTSIVDLFARSGHLFEAVNLLEILQYLASKEAWIALLSACRTYREGALGLKCFQNIVQNDIKYAPSYSLMANIFSSAGIGNDIDEFVFGDKQNKEVLTMLETLSLPMSDEAAS